MQEEKLWQAVMSRDAGSDGAFVYAVRSTGVYCRPSCPSRRPRRAQVVFFPHPQAAEQAGFRPCRRCRPAEDGAPGPQVDLVRQACEQIEASVDGPLTLAALGAQLSVSPYHLQRTFKRVMGITPRQYAEARRLDRLKAGLKNGGAVTEALYDAGYGSSSRLYEQAPYQLGMTPAVYRRGGKEMRIDYTIVDSPLGRLLVGATDKGICSVSLGDSDGALEAELAGEYPAAQVHRDGAGLAQWVGALLAYMEGGRPDLDLPLDIQATAFQWRVWQELRNTPYGSTRSYGEIARAIGDPGAARAVAHACGSNPVAMVIPCHRVVEKNGGLGGYRWGVQKKRSLLAREQESVERSPAPALTAR